MNIALVTDDYIPYSTRIAGKMLHELSVCLNEMGHSVTVITPHFSNQKFIQEEIDNIKIWRFKSGVIKNVNLFIRAINESFLSYRAWNAIKKKVTTKSFDAVIYYSPSIFWGNLVKNLKKRCNCKFFLILRDLFPQWVV
ncbi:MAG: glycosyltransferase family 4 protein, partial [Treponema sp.]|nr:glycosyltransferase family 4 protein [Treponema sp.]